LAALAALGALVGLPAASAGLTGLDAGVADGPGSLATAWAEPEAVDVGPAGDRAGLAGPQMPGVPVHPDLTEVPYLGTFCFISSDLGKFCTGNMFPRPGQGPAPEEATAAPEEAAPVARPTAQEEPTASTAALETAPADAMEDNPPEIVVPRPDGGDSRHPAPAALGRAPAPAGSALAWAIATAAAVLPWAIGVKLASLLALRRTARPAETATLREAVLQAVGLEPGIRHTDLVRRIGRGNGTVEHHVRGLLAERRLERVRGLGATCYFVAGAVSGLGAHMRMALHGRTSLAIARAVAAAPGMRLADVARRVGVSAPTAHYQAGKLARAGILRDEGDGPGRRLAVTAAGLACLAGLAEAPTRDVAAVPVRAPAAAPSAALA
jgi:hypothetical protein